MRDKDQGTSTVNRSMILRRVAYCPPCSDSTGKFEKPLRSGWSDFVPERKERLYIAGLVFFVKRVDSGFVLRHELADYGKTPKNKLKLRRHAICVLILSQIIISPAPLLLIEDNRH